jgi:hypothetical protein
VPFLVDDPFHESSLKESTEPEGVQGRKEIVPEER